MERKIGEVFEYNGEWYQCIINDSYRCDCDYCDFGRLGDCNIIACTSGERKDGKEVYFKKLEKVGEPYMAHDHSRNKDVVVQDYKLYNQHACYNGHEEMLSFGLYGRVGMVTIKSKEPIKRLNCENSVEIQIKEDMEENKLNLKPFDIQKAREGKPVCTRDGAKARIICFDTKSDAPIIALITIDDETEIAFDYLSDGTFFNSENPDNDLMMLPEKKEGWVNVMEGTAGKVYVGNNIYRTEDEAKEDASRFTSKLIANVHIEWEE